MNTEHLTCITCDFFKKHPEGNICTNPDLSSTDPVTGESITVWCEDMRTSDWCGPHGMFHETDGQLTRFIK